VAGRFPDPAVQQSLAVERALIDDDDCLWGDLALSLVKTATQHDATTFYRRPAMPGLGKLLALVLLDAIHNLERFPRGQDVVSSCRLVQGAQAAAGKRYGTSGTQIGNASLTWAFSETAVWFLRANPVGQQSLARLEKKSSQGQALTVLAHQLARAVSDRRKRDMVFDRPQCPNGEGSGAGAPVASLAYEGISLHRCSASPDSLRPCTRLST
jgi:hypothetical protein